MKIRIFYLNIEYGASINKGYWQYITSLWKYIIPHNIFALKTIAKLINYWNADICAFVEMDGGSFRTMNINYVKKLSNMTVLKKWSFFPVRRFLNLSNQGNAIITKFPIVETHNYKLITKGENRCLSHAILDINGVLVNIFITQLALGKISRKYELTQISDIIKKTKGPIILVGDFNTQKEKELKIIDSLKLKRIKTSNTFPSWNPKRTIDYIFVNDYFEIINTEVITDLKISDHLPIISEIILKE